MPLNKKLTLRFRTTDLQFYCMKLGITMPFTRGEEKTKWTEILHINRKSQNFLFWILWTIHISLVKLGTLVLIFIYKCSNKCHGWAQWYNTLKSFQLNLTLKMQTDFVLSLLQKVKFWKLRLMIDLIESFFKLSGFKWTGKTRKRVRTLSTPW